MGTRDSTPQDADAGVEPLHHALGGCAQSGLEPGEQSGASARSPAQGPEPSWQLPVFRSRWTVASTKGLRGARVRFPW